MLLTSNCFILCGTITAANVFANAIKNRHIARRREAFQCQSFPNLFLKKIMFNADYFKFPFPLQSLFLLRRIHIEIGEHVVKHQVEVIEERFDILVRSLFQFDLQ